MSTKKKILIAAGVLGVIGAVAAIAAPGDRDWGGRGGRSFSPENGNMGRGSFWRGGSITADDYDARTRERFASIDKNGDGILDAAEIAASFEKQGGSRWGRGGQRGAEGGDRMMQGFLARFDLNRDGKVTREEFDGTIKRLFAELDLNNDGKITDDDLPPMMRGRGVLSKGAAGPGSAGMPGRGGDRRTGRDGAGGAGAGGGMMLLGFLRGADTKTDGVITLDEALAHAGKQFTTLDRNKDGVLDAADGASGAKEMTDYRVKRFIHSFGADADGKVTRDQFYKVAKERFARADTNGDGRIDRGERGGGGRRWEGRGDGDERGEGRGRRGERGDRSERGRGPGDDAGPGSPSGPAGDAPKK